MSYQYVYLNHDKNNDFYIFCMIIKNLNSKNLRRGFYKGFTF